jgi:hypothetical protein
MRTASRAARTSTAICRRSATATPLGPAVRSSRTGRRSRKGADVEAGYRFPSRAGVAATGTKSSPGKWCRSWRSRSSVRGWAAQAGWSLESPARTQSHRLGPEGLRFNPAAPTAARGHWWKAGWCPAWSHPVRRCGARRCPGRQGRRPVRTCAKNTSEAPIFACGGAWVKAATKPWGSPARLW